MRRTIPRRSKEDIPPWEPQFTKDDNGFVVESKWWCAVDIYPCSEARIRGVNIYRTMHDEYIPLQCSIVSTQRNDNRYAWPLAVAIQEEFEKHFGEPAFPIRYGIRENETSKVHDWRTREEFPVFNDRHAHIGSPDFVLMSAVWVPVTRHPSRPAPR